MRNIVLMAALGAAFLVTGCGPGDTMMMPPPDCSLPGELAEGCSELRLSSTPGGAAVTIDGEALGITPTLPGEALIWRGPVGTVTVEATLAGYEPYLEDVVLGTGRAVDHNAVLEPTVAAMGTLMVTADVPGGTLVLDGIEMGTMPMDPLEVPEGEHRVTVRLDGYAAAEPTVSVVRMETAMVNVGVGGDLTGPWNCDVAGFRVVEMRINNDTNRVFARGMNDAFELWIIGNTISATDAVVTGSISTDRREVNYFVDGSVSDLTEQCTRM